MSTQAPPVVVFLAFADDRSDADRTLRNLPEERRRLRAAMKPAEEAGHCAVLERANASVDEVLDAFQDARYRDRVAIFHFAGHAGDAELLLEAAGGDGTETAHAAGLLPPR